MLSAWPLFIPHDDLIKWKYFPRYWSFVRGILISPVNSPHKGQWRGALMFSLICAWINGLVNNREAGDWRRRSDDYDVSVMQLGTIVACLKAKWKYRLSFKIILTKYNVGSAHTAMFCTHRYVTSLSTLICVIISKKYFLFPKWHLVSENISISINDRSVTIKFVNTTMPAGVLAPKCSTVKY